MSAPRHRPLVSVVVPVFNAEAFMGEALESALGQTLRDHEIVVVDDGSTDGTLDLLRRFEPAITILRQPNGGPAVARNTGILHSRGEYVAFLDADDAWLPDKLEQQVALLECNPQTVLVHGDSVEIGDAVAPGAGRLQRYENRGTGRVFEKLLARNFVHTSCVLVRRAALARSGLFDPALRGPEDYDLWLRLALVGEFDCVDDVVARYRRHPGGVSRTVGFSEDAIRLLRQAGRRWGADGEVRRLVRRGLAESYWLLGYKQRRAGDRFAAASAYLHSAWYGHRRFGSLARAVACGLPSAKRSENSPERPAERNDESAVPAGERGAAA